MDFQLECSLFAPNIKPQIMKRLLISFAVVFVTLSYAWSQKVINTLTFENDTLKETPVMFYNNHKKDIVKYDGNTITLLDVYVLIPYKETIGSDHLYGTSDKYIFISGNCNSPLSFFKRERATDKFTRRETSEIESLKPAGENYSFYLPEKFKITVKDGVVVFSKERYGYLIEKIEKK